MAQTAGYAQHPPHFASYHYQTPPRPSPEMGAHAYYTPRQYSYSAPPQRNHARRATDGGYTRVYTTPYATPERATYTSPQYARHDYYATAQSSPQRKADYVSASARSHKGTHHHIWVEINHDGRSQRRQPSTKQQYGPRSRYQHYGESPASSEENLPRYEQYESRPPPYNYTRTQTYYYNNDDARADFRHGHQVPIYKSAEPKSSTRHASYHAQPQRPAPPPRRKSTYKPPPQATAQDARAAGIPAGFSYKNWDPTEEPILLLGSVFDANSLGKWIYDWTVYSFGPATPMSEIAGDLWLLLIQLAGKIKRAEDCLSRIRRKDSRKLVDDFLRAGDRLWDRFGELLKLCEGYMWKAAKREHRGSRKTKGTPVTMGNNSGREFVDAIFGRDRELAKTEKLMAMMRLWSMRFDANCEEILRNPSAA